MAAQPRRPDPSVPAERRGSARTRSVSSRARCPGRSPCRYGCHSRSTRRSGARPGPTPSRPLRGSGAARALLGHHAPSIECQKILTSARRRSCVSARTASSRIEPRTSLTTSTPTTGSPHGFGGRGRGRIVPERIQEGAGDVVRAQVREQAGEAADVRAHGTPDVSGRDPSVAATLVAPRRGAASPCRTGGTLASLARLPSSVAGAALDAEGTVADGRADGMLGRGGRIRTDDLVLPKHVR
jgi:hypothetical protein